MRCSTAVALALNPRRSTTTAPPRSRPDTKGRRQSPCPDRDYAIPRAPVPLWVASARGPAPAGQVHARGGPDGVGPGEHGLLRPRRRGGDKDSPVQARLPWSVALQAVYGRQPLFRVVEGQDLAVDHTPPEVRFRDARARRRTAFSRVGGVVRRALSPHVLFRDDERGEAEREVVEATAHCRFLHVHHAPAEAIVVGMVPLEGSVDEQREARRFGRSAVSLPAYEVGVVNLEAS